MGGAPETLWNPDFDGLRRRKGTVEDRLFGFRQEKSLDFSGFIPGPKKGGHSTGLGGFRSIGKPIDSTIDPNPLSVLHVVEVDAVGIADFNGLAGGETSVLALGQFP